MKIALLALIALMIGVFDIFVLWAAWFTLGFFGSGWGTALVALVSVALAGIATAYGANAWHRVLRGETRI